jgi:hypothetical protein
LIKNLPVWFPLILFVVYKVLMLLILLSVAATWHHVVNNLTPLDVAFPANPNGYVVVAVVDTPVGAARPGAAWPGKLNCTRAQYPVAAT